MENLVITHTNFRQQRHAYNISLEEIAKKAGLSVSCISAFERFTSKYTETRTRDENASTITQALNDLIEERLSNLFAKKAAKEEKKVEEKVAAKNVNMEYDRAKIGEKIRKYCKASNIGLVEFCKMCDIGIDSFSVSRVARSPYVYPKTLRKICKATGWNVGMLIGPDDIPIKKPVTTATYNQKNYTPPVGEMFDVKYICQDGRYFREYKSVHIHKDELTKNEFINQITKEEK